jgi:hypothetical protein
MALGNIKGMLQTLVHDIKAALLPLRPAGQQQDQVTRMSVLQKEMVT